MSQCLIDLMRECGTFEDILSDEKKTTTPSATAAFFA
jgi:hypothetical protein